MNEYETYHPSLSSAKKTVGWQTRSWQKMDKIEGVLSEN